MSQCPGVRIGDSGAKSERTMSNIRVATVRRYIVHRRLSRIRQYEESGISGCLRSLREPEPHVRNCLWGCSLGKVRQSCSPPYLVGYCEIRGKLPYASAVFQSATVQTSACEMDRGPMEVYWSLLTCEVLRVRLIVLNIYWSRDLV